MIVKQRITEDDKEKLENMLSCRYAMPYEAFGNRKRAHMVLYILTPILLLLSINCYYIKNYVMFWISLVVTIASTRWIIWYRLVGVKFERRVHDVIQGISSVQSAVLDEEGIQIDNLYKYTEIIKAIVYDQFVFVITEKKKLIIIKAEGSKQDEMMHVLEKYNNIETMQKDKPFNIYEYLK